MYRPGLGDCFLVSFGDGERAYHVLIDCGVFVGTPNEKATLQTLARHIVESVGGVTPGSTQRLGAVVATHEHWDHVAGFFHARDILQQLRPDEVWVAWTEDPDQKIATELRAQHAERGAALQMAAQQLAQSPSPYDRECGLALADVLGFGGEASAEMLGSRFSRRSNEGMEFVSNELPGKRQYLKPGQTMEFPWIPGGLRVYALGPPMDRNALSQNRTSLAEGFKSHQQDGAETALMAALLGADQSASDEEQKRGERLRPFDASRALPEEDVFREIERRTVPLNAFASGVDADAWQANLGLFREYQRDAERRIDADWLHSAAGLALQLDRSINNTSLVLAFEMVESGKVLLFVGDAELENWKSWQDMKFAIQDNDCGTQKEVTVRSLLERTVFYKVGHHGSGNATLRAALEQMTSPELVAAIPTDEVFARDKKKWEMPAAMLRPELLKRTKGRVIDATPSVLPIAKPDGAQQLISDRAWQRFASAVNPKEAGSLYVDYVIGLPPGKE